jgi:hypothetical protein
MTDTIVTPDPAIIPPVADGVKEDWRKETFKARSERDAETKKANDLAAELDKANKQISSNQSTGVELLRLKLSYVAGVPQHLLNLVTANDEAGINAQIKTITDALVTGNTTPASTPDTAPAVTPATAPAITPAPLPSGKIGESWLSKYNKASAEDKQKMMDETKENGSAFKIS